jgi:hypothetical protein
MRSFETEEKEMQKKETEKKGRGGGEKKEKSEKRERKNWNVLFVSVFCSWAGTKFIDKRSAASCHPMANSVIVKKYEEREKPTRCNN